MTYEIKALGDHVILKAIARSAGTEILSGAGIVIGIREQGEIPEMCTVHSVGCDVPEDFISVNDKCPVPLGNMRNVPHPEVALGLKEAKDIDEKFFTVHYKNVPCIYTTE